MKCMRNSASNYNESILWTNWGFNLSMIYILNLFFLITFEAILDNLTPTLAYWKGASGEYNATPENPSKKTGPHRKLTRLQEFLITLLRLSFTNFCHSRYFGDFMH